MEKSANQNGDRGAERAITVLRCDQRIEFETVKTYSVRFGRKEGTMNSQEQARFEQKEDQNSSGFGSNSPNPAFAESVRVNQKKLRSELKSQYDFIVCAPTGMLVLLWHWPSGGRICS